LEAEVQNFDSGLPLKEQLGTINAEMAGHRDVKRGIQEQLTQLMEKRKDELGDMPELIEQKDKISAGIREKIAERNQIRDDFRVVEREYSAFLADQRRIRQDKYAEERAQQNKEWDLQRKEREIEKLDDQPYVSEMTLVEQTIKFCKSLMPQDGANKAEKEVKEVVHNNKAGEVVLAKKGDRDEEFCVAPTKKKASKSKGGKTSTKAIKHNAETFKLFDSMKLDAPITTDDIPDLLVKLEAKMDDYKEKVAVWDTSREARKQKILAGIVDEDKSEEKVAEGDDDKKEDDKKEEDKKEDDKKEEDKKEDA